MDRERERETERRSFSSMIPTVERKADYKRRKDNKIYMAYTHSTKWSRTPLREKPSHSTV